VLAVRGDESNRLAAIWDESAMKKFERISKCLLAFCKCLLAFCLFALALFAGSANATLIVTNGDLESPDIGGLGWQTMPNPWFQSTAQARQHSKNFIKSDAGNGYTKSQHIAFAPNAYVYQSLGSKSSGETGIDWTFFQGRFSDNNSTAGFSISFYEGNGVFAGANGTDVAGVGLTQIDSTYFAPLGNPGPDGRINTGTLDITSVADGTEIWLRIGSDSGGYAPVDDVAIMVVPEPATLALLGLGMIGLVIRRKLTACRSSGISAGRRA
jgi:hypothetical protein